MIIELFIQYNKLLTSSITMKKSIHVPLALLNIIVYHFAIPIMTGIIMSRCIRTIPVNDVFALTPDLVNDHSIFLIQDIKMCDTIDSCIEIGRHMLKSNTVTTIGFQSFDSMNSGWTKPEIILLTYLVFSVFTLIASSVHTCFYRKNSTPQFVSLILYFIQTLISFIFIIVISVLQWKVVTQETKVIFIIFSGLVLVPILGTVIIQYILNERFNAIYRSDGYDSVWDTDNLPQSE